MISKKRADHSYRKAAVAYAAMHRAGGCGKSQIHGRAGCGFRFRQLFSDLFGRAAAAARSVEEFAAIRRICGIWRARRIGRNRGVEKTRHPQHLRRVPETPGIPAVSLCRCGAPYFRCVPLLSRLLKPNFRLVPASQTLLRPPSAASLPYSYISTVPSNTVLTPPVSST